MSHFNIRVRGEQALSDKAHSLQYHWADRHGQMYLCNCHKSFRIGTQVKHIHSKRNRNGKAALARLIAR